MNFELAAAGRTKHTTQGRQGMNKSRTEYNAPTLSRSASRGMTLLEIMVVLAIIGLIVGGVAVAAFGQLGAAKIKTATNEVTQIESVCEMYMVQKNKCPKDMQELKAGGILKKSKKDPWGTAFQITCPGEHGDIDVASAGPDKQFGSEDDVNSWDEGDAEGNS